MSVLLLFSGGIDSTVLAHEALNAGRLSLLMFARYGQPAAAKEARAVGLWRTKHAPSVKLWEPMLPIAAEAMQLGVGVPGPRVLPGRNLLLLSLAITRAAADGIPEVWYGAQGGDLADYPDCRPDFVAAVNELATPWGVAVKAPLIQLTKAEVIEQARRLGVELAKTWSCYEPQRGAPCGRCNACRARIGSLGARLGAPSTLITNTKGNP